MSLLFGPDRSGEGRSEFHPLVIQIRVNVLLGVAKGGVQDPGCELMPSLSEVSTLVSYEYGWWEYCRMEGMECHPLLPYRIRSKQCASHSLPSHRLGHWWID